MTRKRIPTETEIEILYQSGRRCCICFGIHQDIGEKSGQIAHLDRNNQNNNLENLAFLCLEHHNKYDTRTSQSKGYTSKEVKKYREELHRYIVVMRSKTVTGAEKEDAIETGEWWPLFSALHYINVPRITMACAEQGLHAIWENTSLANISSARGLNPNQYYALVIMTRALLKAWKPKAISIKNSSKLAEKFVGTRIKFEHTAFRSKGIPWLSRSKVASFELSGNLEEDPHLYLQLKAKRVVFPIDPIWITTDTAFTDLAPKNGVTSPFTGLGVLKFASEDTVIVTPLVIGIRDPMEALNKYFE